MTKNKKQDATTGVATNGDAEKKNGKVPVVSAKEGKGHQAAASAEESIDPTQYRENRLNVIIISCCCHFLGMC
jgi:hypothetical protein